MLPNGYDARNAQDIFRKRDLLTLGRFFGQPNPRY
jgi:hypothetical protein